MFRTHSNNNCASFNDENPTIIINKLGKKKKKIQKSRW